MRWKRKIYSQVADHGPSGRILREMGYLSDQEGIMNRYLREDRGWTTHLENTRRYILGVVEKEKPQSVAVLGSGWLLDIPLEELSLLCREVALFDIFHPPQVVNRAGDLPNVRLVCTDLTGGYVEKIYQLSQSYKKNRVKTPLDSLSVPPYKPEIETDLIASVNLLNQLDMHPVDFLRKLKLYDEHDFVVLRQMIQENHIRFLAAKGAILITDYSELQYTAAGELTCEKSLVYTEIPQGMNNQEWIWQFDTTGSYHRKKLTSFRVMARKFRTG